MSRRGETLTTLSRAGRFGWIMPAALTAVLVIAALGTFGVYGQRQLVVIAVYTLIVSGINLTFGYAGELAFGQVATFAVGAYVTGILSQHGVTDLVLAVLLSTAAAGVIGLVTGLPGLRLGHWSLAIVSFFLVVMIPVITTLTQSETGGLQGLSGIFDPTVFGFQLGWRGFFVFAIVITFVWLMIMRNLVLSRYGTSLKMLRESPLLAQSVGVPLYRARIQAYIVGSLPSGAAGALYAYLTGFLSPGAFTLELSIALLAACVVGGADSIYGAALGAALLVLGPLQAAAFQQWSLLVYGVFLVVVGVGLGSGLAGLVRLAVRRLGLMPALVAVDDAGPTDAEAEKTLNVPGARLGVEGVTRAFGGVLALAGVDLVAQAGRITAILGPNGAGKTTLLNAVSGFVPADAGHITLGDQDLVGLRADQVAAIGVGRTFQTPIIPRSATVLEVVESGRISAGRVRSLAAVLRLPAFRRARQGDRDVALATLRFAGLHHLAHQDAQSLPLGTRRLLEVARAVAREPRVLLLDEPAAGLDDTALAELGQLLRRTRDAGATVVIVEHNINFVLGLADDVVVMGLGKVVASGSPDEIRRNPAVIASYLGRRFGDVRAEDDADSGAAAANRVRRTKDASEISR